jgi:hypothetical protein
MEQFNFKSSVCTSRVQSERLLALGLKKETADCYWWQENDQYGDGNGKWHLEVLDTKEAREHFEYLDKFFDDELFIPAWSLHRLMILTATPLELDEMLGYNIYDYYDNAINHIESLIKEGYFNKEYLV